MESPAIDSGLRPDSRLVGLHTERGDAQARLERALADLEGADWGLSLAGEAALAHQLRGLLGAGVLRLDGRLPLRRDLLAEAGLAPAGLEGDWRGAQAVWLLEPGDDDLARAQRAGVPVIVDAALAPGGHWLARGAALVTYHHAAGLTGFAQPELALLFGAGERPAIAARAVAPADLSVAQALRDVATLPLRLARTAQTAGSLLERWAGRALPLGPTALLLPPETAEATAAPLGGVLPAVRPVQGGVIVTPGLADVRQVAALLNGRRPGEAEAPATPAPDAAPTRTAPAPEPTLQSGPTPDRPLPSSESQAAPTPVQGVASPVRGEPARAERPERAERAERPERPERSGRRDRDRGRDRGPQRNEPRMDGPRSGEWRPGAQDRRPQPARPAAPQLERFVFEAPAQGDRRVEPEVETIPASPAQAADPATDLLALHAGGHPAPSDAFVEPLEPALPEGGHGGADHAAAQAGADQPGDLGESGAAVPSAEMPSTEMASADGHTEERHTEERRGAEKQGAGSRSVGSHGADVLRPDLPAGKGRAQDLAADLTEEQAAIFARLRKWRDAEAVRQEISRFIVASNATLIEIARRVPYTAEDLQAIKGMGPARLSKYGDAILRVVRG